MIFLNFQQLKEEMSHLARMIYLSFKRLKEEMLDVARMIFHHFRRPTKRKKLLPVARNNQTVNVGSGRVLNINNVQHKLKQPKKKNVEAEAAKQPKPTPETKSENTKSPTEAESIFENCYGSHKPIAVSQNNRQNTCLGSTSR